MIAEIERNRHDLIHRSLRSQQASDRPRSSTRGPERDRQIARLLALVASIQSADRRKD